MARDRGDLFRALSPERLRSRFCFYVNPRQRFAANDERTVKRVSDALGTTTEIRDAKSRSGHRLSPRLGHLMVSRQDTVRPLLKPGEIIQLPPAEELVLVSGLAPINDAPASPRKGVVDDEVRLIPSIGLQIGSVGLQLHHTRRGAGGRTCSRRTSLIGLPRMRDTELRRFAVPFA